jgi:hypothetical protein
LTEKEFTSKWTQKLSSESLKKFPEEFSSINEFKEENFPAKTLVIGKEFFGAFEILTVDGKSVYQAKDYNEAKYIIYSNRANKNNPVKIPLNSCDIKSSVIKFESYMDSIIKEIEIDFRKTFPDSKNSTLVVNNVLRIINLTRY